MKSLANRFGAAILLLGSLALVGCLPSGRSEVDEEKESHFLTGKSRVSQMDAKGAIESFEKALEVNPRSGAAHFELALLFEKNGTDPAAAIYHYEQYLKLRPGAENAEILVKPHIMACKQELARAVSLGAVTERQQHDFELLAEENIRLKGELNDLRARFATNNSPAVAPIAARTAQIATPSPSSTAGSGSASRENPVRASPGNATYNAGNPARTMIASTSASRTHTVKYGETPTTIARKYGVNVNTLMAANPRLDARRLKVGQVVSVPPSS